MKKLLACVFAAALAGAASAVQNDTYATATEIDNSLYSGTVGPVNNADATESPGDPLCALGSYGKTVWFKWTAPAGGNIQFNTKDSTVSSRVTTPLDTVMCVCQLDGDGVPYLSTAYGGGDAFSDNAYTNLTSFVELGEVYAGETYYIGIGTKLIQETAVGPVYGSGEIKLSWSYLPEMATVRFNPQGGTATTTTLRLLGAYALGQFGDVPVPVRGGYEFLGWFTDPAGGVEVTGDDTYHTLKDYIEDGYLNLYAHWRVAGLVTPQLQSFDKAQLFTGAFLTVSYGVVGSVEIKVAKKGAKNTAKVTVRVTRYENGKKIGARGTLTVNADGSATSDDIVVKFNDDKRPDDTMRMTVNPDGTFEMKGARYFVEAAQVGGALTFGGFTFDIPEFNAEALAYHLPTAPAGFKVIAEALPTNFVFSFASQGRKFSIPTGKALKYALQKSASRPGRVPASGAPGSRQLKIYKLTGLEDSNPNKSSLKLAYNYRTGLYKGTFAVYMTNGASYIANGGLSEVGQPKLKKYVVKVVGLVLANKGFGMATLKDTNQEWFSFLNP